MNTYRLETQDGSDCYIAARSVGEAARIAEDELRAAYKRRHWIYAALYDGECNLVADFVESVDLLD